MAAYVLVGALALGFDLLTDRSFGAVMLAVLPISAISLACLVVGPWLEGERKPQALMAWIIGACLVLVVSIAFSLIGTEQAKTGEVVFTYAAIFMALPGTLVLPVGATLLEPLLAGNVILRIVVMWTICAAVGYLEWKALGAFSSSLQRRQHRRRS